MESLADPSQATAIRHQDLAQSLELRLDPFRERPQVNRAILEDLRQGLHLDLRLDSRLPHLDSHWRDEEAQDLVQRSMHQRRLPQLPL